MQSLLLYKGGEVGMLDMDLFQLIPIIASHGQVNLYFLIFVFQKFLTCNLFTSEGKKGYDVVSK